MRKTIFYALYISERDYEDAIEFRRMHSDEKEIYTVASNDAMKSFIKHIEQYPFIVNNVRLVEDSAVKYGEKLPFLEILNLSKKGLENFVQSLNLPKPKVYERN